MQLQKNQHVFLSFAFTGRDPETVMPQMTRICETLKDIGLRPYCDLFDDGLKKLERAGEFVVDALDHVKKSDVLLVVKDSGQRSEGQLMEVGAAVALGVPIILLLHKSAKDVTYLHDPEIASQTFIWSAVDDLEQVIRSLVKSPSLAVK
jgi:nucleoside 2-deoxyribosyltransferase